RLQHRRGIRGAESVYQSAIEMRIAMKIGSMSPSQLQELAWTIATCPFRELRTEHLALAEESARRAFEAVPENPKHPRALALVLASNNPQAAINILQTPEQRDGEYSAAELFVRAIANYRLGQRDEANNLFRSGEALLERTPGVYEFDVLWELAQTELAK
ncbi:MAG: hypothetical protein AAGJ83_03130, partial [Planctomycetota bacterium]